MSEPRDKKGLTEEEFLRQYDPGKYPRPSLTADVVIFRRGRDRSPEVLLVRRGGHPFLGRWALPGGFAMKDEPLDRTAARELMEETGVAGAELTLVGVYSAPGRDPRGWTVSAAYAAAVEKTEARAGDDAADVRWFPLRQGVAAPYELPDGPTLAPDARGRRLAFDHDDILADAIRVIFG